MAKRDMKKALGASLKAEEQAVKSRFEKAKTVLREKVPVPREQPKLEEPAQVMRDSFTIPDGEDERIAQIKRRCLKAGISINKSEVLSGGLAALDALPDRELERLFESLPRVKTRRPRREIRIFVVHQFARKVIIGHRIVKVSVRKLHLMNL